MSRDLSQAEKNVTIAKLEQIHKMTIFFSQICQKLNRTMQDFQRKNENIPYS